MVKLMNNRRLMLICVSAFLLQSCTASYVALNEVDHSHVIGRKLNEEQIKQAILTGADNAGWKAEDLGNNGILATYRIRVHTVKVKIYYTDSSYTTTYDSSVGLKMFCNDYDRYKTRRKKISGLQECPGNLKPRYVHGNYKKWMETLEASIDKQIGSI